MTASQHRPMLRFLLLLTVASTLGLQGWQLLFNNFAVDVVQQSILPVRQELAVYRRLPEFIHEGEVHDITGAG
jgi:hypothetical protein